MSAGIVIPPTTRAGCGRWSSTVNPKCAKTAPRAPSDGGWIGRSPCRRARRTCTNDLRSPPRWPRACARRAGARCLDRPGPGPRRHPPRAGNHAHAAPLGREHPRRAHGQLDRGSGREPWPFDMTKRSRSGHRGFAGLWRRESFQRTSAISAMPMGAPGCPDLACSTASMERTRMAFASSRRVGRQASCLCGLLTVRIDVPGCGPSPASPI
jgi:hypothetical protein